MNKYTPLNYMLSIGLLGILFFLTGNVKAENIAVILVEFAVIGTIVIFNTLLQRSIKSDHSFSTVNGIGYNLISWGNKKYANEWVVVLFIPLFPVATYEIFQKESVGIFARKYQLSRVRFNHKQAVIVYFVYLLALLIVTFI